MELDRVAQEIGIGKLADLQAVFLVVADNFPVAVPLGTVLAFAKGLYKAVGGTAVAHALRVLKAGSVDCKDCVIAFRDHIDIFSDAADIAGNADMDTA